MGFFKSLFKGPELASQGLDVIRKTGDALVYTKEERAEMHQKFLKLYEPFKLAQRYLALIFSIPYVSISVLGLLMCGLTAAMEPCTLETLCRAAHVKSSATEMIEWNNELLGQPVAIILCFYFMGGAAEGYARARVEGAKK